MTEPRSGLADPQGAAVAWAHYRRMMRWVGVVAILAAALALGWLHFSGGLITIHMVIATIAGVGLTVLLAGALMLAAFLSSGTGHDEDVASDPKEWK